MTPRYDVKDVQDRGHYWQVVYDATHDNGFVTEHGHSIPKETLEWRAAEYDLDPVTEFDTILDIVVAEPYITTEETAGSVTGKELHDAPDIATARSLHISRCARAKLKHRIATRKTPNGDGKAPSQAASENPFDVIRTGAVIDPLVVAVKKEHVRRAREERALQRAPETSIDRAKRVAESLNIDLEALRRPLRAPFSNAHPQAEAI